MVNSKLQIYSSIVVLLLAWVLRKKQTFHKIFVYIGAESSCRVTSTLPAVKDNKLVNHVVATYEVNEQETCEVKYFMHSSCVSYNLGAKIEGRLRVCQLCDADHIRHPLDLRESKGFIYVAFEVGT